MKLRAKIGRQHWLPVACLVGSCALWGVSFPIIKALHLDQGARLPGASTAFLAAWMQFARFLLGALLLAPLLACTRPTANELCQGAWVALWGGLGMGLQADGLARTAASTSAFLKQAYCVFLPLIACLRQRRPPDARTVVATALVLVGGAVLSGMRLDDLRLGRGEAETLLAAFLFTFQILVLQDDRFAGNRGVPVTFAMCAMNKENDATSQRSARWLAWLPRLGQPKDFGTHGWHFVNVPAGTSGAPQPAPNTRIS